ncbi:MAG: TRIC cation channel family protein [Kineosporiaceae bacterium]|nr:TRIC cation channel family protein [Kineosporiaceae bacterium]
MPPLPDIATDTPLWLALITVAVNAVVGALLGYLDDAAHWDVVGVTVFALLMGLGGGFIRDTLLGRLPPQSLRSPWSLVTVLAAAALVLVIGPLIPRIQRTMSLLNAVALGLFAVSGAAAARATGLPAISGVLIGTASAVGGGVMVAVLQNRVATILLASTPHALLAILAATVYLLIPGNPTVAALGGVLAVVVAQLVVDRWQITTPPARRRPTS